MSALSDGNYFSTCTLKIAASVVLAAVMLLLPTYCVASLSSLSLLHITAIKKMYLLRGIAQLGNTSLIFERVTFTCKSM